MKKITYLLVILSCLLSIKVMAIYVCRGAEMENFFAGPMLSKTLTIETIANEKYKITTQVKKLNGETLTAQWTISKADLAVFGANTLEDINLVSE